MTRVPLAALLVALALPAAARGQCDEGPHGSHAHNWEAGLSGGNFNGHRWRIDEDAELIAIEFEARIPSGTTISWLVYEAAAEEGPWVQVFRQDTTSPGPNAYSWHSSGAINHVLDAGTWIVVGAHVPTAWGHSGGVGADPATAWFGEAISGANVGGNATPPEAPGFGHNYWTPTRIRVNSEPDIDDDGFSGCVDDCDDRDSDVHPGADEVCDNAVDDDCDELVDEADPDCEGDDDDAVDDDDSSVDDDDDDTTSDDDDTTSDGGRRSGCGCAQVTPSAAAPGLLLLVVLGLHRRRQAA